MRISFARTRHQRPCPRMTSHEHRPTACHLKKEKATSRLSTRVQLTTNMSYSILNLLYFLMVPEGRNMKLHKTRPCLVQTLNSSSTQPKWELYPWTFISANHHLLNCSVEKVALYSNLGCVWESCCSSFLKCFSYRNTSKWYFFYFLEIIFDISISK